MTSSNAGAARHTLENLKRRATALKKAEGLTHHEALERIAQEVGFASYRQAHKKLQDANSASSQSDVEGTKESKEEKSTNTRKSNKLPSAEEFKRRSRRDFGMALGECSDGTSVPIDDLDEIIGFLDRVFSSASTNCFLPPGGDFRFTGARRGPEPGTMALLLDGKGTRICKPAFMELHYVTDSPSDSVIVLHLDRLETTDTYDDERREWCEDRGVEEIAIGPDGANLPREVLDEAEIDGARLRVRFLHGKMLIAATGGIWSGMPRASSALHARFSTDEIGFLIGRIIEEYGVPV